MVVRCVITDPFWCQLQVSSVKNVLLFVGQGGHTSHGKSHDLLLGRKEKEREPSSIYGFSSAFRSKKSICQSGSFGGQYVLKSFNTFL